MGSGVSHAVERVVVWQKGVFRRATKSKLENFHPWKMEGVTQVDHVRRDQPQVFGDDR